LYSDDVFKMCGSQKRKKKMSEIAEQSDYMKYRGKCKEFCEKAIQEDPTLTLVRGHYYCPAWNTEEPHWWTVTPNGEIYDPTAKQFPSKGHGVYTPFDGTVTCSNCEKKGDEKEFTHHSRYSFCSYECYGQFIGF
jgi:hypothetical protein